MLLLSLSFAKGFSEDDEVARCLQSAMLEARLNASEPDWNCGGSAGSATCLRKGWVALREGLLCVQKYSTARDLDLFTTGSLATPEEANKTYQCLYNRIDTCSMSNGNSCTSFFECTASWKCIATVTNLCLKTELLPVSRIKPHKSYVNYDLTPFHDCTKQRKCGSQVCHAFASYDCAVSTGLLPFYSSKDAAFLMNAPEQECAEDGFRYCLGGGGMCGEDATYAECVEQLRCTAEVVNRCAKQNLIPTRLIPTGVASEADCSKPLSTLCTPNKRCAFPCVTQRDGAQCSYACGKFDAICAAEQTLYCTASSEALETLKMELKVCKKRVNECDPSEWCLGDVFRANPSRCYAALNCAVRGSVQCANSAVAILFPREGSEGESTDGHDGVPVQVWVGVGCAALAVVLAVIVVVALVVYRMCVARAVPSETTDRDIKVKDFVINSSFPTDLSDSEYPDDVLV